MFVKKNSGFTIIELMVVVAIIGILAAIAIPQFKRYRNRAACSAVQNAAGVALDRASECIAKYYQGIGCDSVNVTDLESNKFVGSITVSVNPSNATCTVTANGAGEISGYTCIGECGDENRVKCSD